MATSGSGMPISQDRSISKPTVWDPNVIRHCFSQLCGLSHLSSPLSFASVPNSTGLESCWFINEAVKHRLESISLMPRQSLPVNSLDVRGTVALVGADNEAFYLLHNLSL